MSGTAGMGIGIIVSMAIDVYYKEQMNVDFKKRLEENRKAIEDMTNRLLRP